MKLLLGCGNKMIFVADLNKPLQRELIVTKLVAAMPPL